MVKAPSVTLEAAVAPDIPNLFNDEEKLRQVILNLLSNAAKFTDEGIIKVKAEMKDEAVVISVEDSGIGIPLEAQKTIFEEFKQADNSSSFILSASNCGWLGWKLRR